MANDNSFLGTGWGFPPTFTFLDQGARMVSDEEDIRESLAILLTTRPGERIMQPNYGCNLDFLQFDPINSTMQAFVKKLIEEAIIYNEPRIALNFIELHLERQLEGILDIELDYTVRTTNSRFNMVFPYYLNEAEVAEQQKLASPPRSFLQQESPESQ